MRGIQFVVPAVPGGQCPPPIRECDFSEKDNFIPDRKPKENDRRAYGYNQKK